LGKGLRALIPEDSKLIDEDVLLPGLVLLPIDAIRPNPFQPRQNFDSEALEALAASIREQGMLQPIVVRKIDGKYEVVVGERRVRAARLANVDRVPAVVKEEVRDDEMLALALVENIQREDLDPMEEARAFKELMKKSRLTQQELADRVGKSREAVANAIRLLNLPPQLQQMVAEGRLSAGHARALLATDQTAKQKSLARLVVSRGLSVRELERLVSPPARRKGSQPEEDPDVKALEYRLEEAVAAKVRLKYRGEKGKIEIYFQSFDELDRIIALLQK
jgi:ParB family chromosome partitioning protein